MSNKKKVDVASSPYRTLLSEVLPFELPTSVSNQGFYQFLSKSLIYADDKKLLFKSSDEYVKVPLQILFEPANITALERDDRGHFRYEVQRPKLETQPFEFDIRHKEDSSRRLSIMHPINQIAIADFYKEYAPLLLLHTDKSNFSIRHPYRIARYTVVRDSVFEGSLPTDDLGVSVEKDHQEYETLRSYFVYRKYSNIHEFYESEEYRGCEKRFGHLLHLDIQKCFESVYTHSLQWAVFGKEAVKSSTSAYNCSFAGKLDRLASVMNYGETHGVLVGSEFARIFVEIILQRVDRDVEKRLQEEGLSHNIDYSILRYVDDFFIFISDPNMRDKIVPIIENALRPYRMHLNRSKEVLNSTPFISELSIAKNELRKQLRRQLRLVKDEDTGEIQFISSSRQLITLYKTVLRESGLVPLDLANYTLVQIELALERSVKQYLQIGKESQTNTVDAEIIKVLASGLQLAFYVYGGSPRATPTMKVARIGALIRRAIESLEVSSDIKKAVDDLIFQEAIGQLRRNPLREEASVENLFLLGLLKDLGEDYLLEENHLLAILSIETDERGEISLPKWWHFLVIVELLSYIGPWSVNYPRLMPALERFSLARLESFNDPMGSLRAEKPILALSLISCPFISEGSKRAIVGSYVRENSRKAVENSQLLRGTWFVNWGPHDLHDDLLKKRVQEVY